MADNEKKVVPFPTPNPVNEPVRPGKSLTVTLSPKGTFIRGLSGSAKENLIPILCVILFLWCEEDPLLESGSFTLSAANWGRYEPYAQAVLRHLQAVVEKHGRVSLLDELSSQMYLAGANSRDPGDDRVLMQHLEKTFFLLTEMVVRNSGPVTKFV